MYADNNFETFAASLADLTFAAAHLRLNEEHARVRRLTAGQARNHRGAPAARERYGVYEARLAGLGFFMVNGGLPSGQYVDGDRPIYRRLAEAWVGRGLLPSVLDVFKGASA
jgi:hypothetical protein